MKTAGKCGGDAIAIGLSVTEVAILGLTSFIGISEELTESHVKYVFWVCCFGALALICRAVCQPRSNYFERIGVLDVAIVMLFVWPFISAWLSGRVVPVCIKTRLLADLSLYLSLRMLFSIVAGFCGKRLKLLGISVMDSILLLLLSFFIIKEGWEGILQLSGRNASHHSRFAITGSFFNPGPYGAWLMLAASVCGCYVCRFGKRFEASLRHLDQMWPFAIYYIVVAIGAALSLALLPVTMSRAAWVGLSVSVIAFLSVERKAIRHWVSRYHQSPRSTIFISVLTGIVSVFLLAGIYIVKKTSADGRLFIDRISCRMISEHPLFGCGAGQYASAYGVAQESFFREQIASESDAVVCLDLEQLSRIAGYEVAGCPSSAFNEYLQIWAETGILGFILLSAVLVLALMRLFGQYAGVARQPSVFAYGLLSMSVFAAFSYPFSLLPFRLWTVIMLALAAAGKHKSSGGCGYGGEYTSVRSRSLQNMALPLCLLFSVLFSCNSLIHLRQRQQAVDSWHKMRAWYSCGYYEKTVDGYSALMDLLADHPRFLFEYGRSLHMIGHDMEALEVLQQGMASSSDPMFLNIAGKACKALASDAACEIYPCDWEWQAEQWYVRAFLRLPNRLYPLYLLARLYYDSGRYEEFNMLKPMVSDFSPKIDSPAISRMKSEIENLVIPQTTE